MSKTRFKAALSALALGGLTVLATPALAGAADAGASPADTRVAAPSGKTSEVSTLSVTADGYLYAYDGINRGGKSCRWFGDDADWSSCSPGGNIRNQASSLWNNGYAGSYEDVNVYWGLSYQRAGACIANGRYLSNLASWYFNDPGYPGNGETLNNNISSHKWSNGC